VHAIGHIESTRDVYGVCGHDCYFGKGRVSIVDLPELGDCVVFVVVGDVGGDAQATVAVGGDDQNKPFKFSQTVIG